MCDIFAAILNVIFAHVYPPFTSDIVKIYNICDLWWYLNKVYISPTSHAVEAWSNILILHIWLKIICEEISFTAMICCSNCNEICIMDAYCTYIAEKDMLISKVLISYKLVEIKVIYTFLLNHEIIIVQFWTGHHDYESVNQTIPEDFNNIYNKNWLRVKTMIADNWRPYW